MGERARNIIVGLTTLAGVAGLVAMLMLFGHLPTWLERGYLVKVELKEAAGLSVGSRVKMSGLDIGRVVALEMETTPRGPMVVVSVLVDESIRIPRGVRARTEQPLIGGSPTLALDVSHLDPRDPRFSELIAPLPTDGSARIVGEAQRPLTEFALQLKAAMAEPTRAFEKLAGALEELSAEWTLVGRNLNLLLEQRSLAEVDQGHMLGNLATVLARADQRLKELEAVTANLQQWTGDPELRQYVHRALANAAELSEEMRQLAAKVSQTTDRATGLIESAGQNLERLVGRLVASADDFSAAVRSLQEAADKARVGEGTLGKLLTDPSLYDNLNDAVVRLKEAIVEFHLLLEKWKKEGLPVQF